MEPGFAAIHPRHVYSEDFEREDGFRSHDARLYSVRLPTQGMYDAALPEGSLADGGIVEGYLYFEKLGDDVQRATLRATLDGSSTPLEIPFVAESGNEG